jgi:hypothetical protein
MRIFEQIGNRHTGKISGNGFGEVSSDSLTDST